MSPAVVRDIGITDANVAGARDCVAILAGENDAGSVINCRTAGVVSEDDYVGGLMGLNNDGSVDQCCSTGIVNGHDYVGGLVGHVSGWIDVDRHDLTEICYPAELYNSCSHADVNANERVGGLIGWGECDWISKCYAAGKVSGRALVGGLAGGGWDIWDCFWDTDSSGQAGSAGGEGRTTIEMQTAGTFLDAGWDLVDETENGTDDIWWILEGQGYPRLWWELIPEN